MLLLLEFSSPSKTLKLDVNRASIGAAAAAAAAAAPLLAVLHYCCCCNYSTDGWKKRIVLIANWMAGLDIDSQATADEIFIREEGKKRKKKKSTSSIYVARLESPSLAGSFLLKKPGLVTPSFWIERQINCCKTLLNGSLRGVSIRTNYNWRCSISFY